MTKKQQTSIENARIMAFWKAQQGAPFTNAISKRSAKKGVQGFHKGVYISQRGISKMGDLSKDVPFPND
jgi:hypothetical protein